MVGTVPKRAVFRIRIRVRIADLDPESRYCRGPNVVIDDGQEDAPNSQLISCLDTGSSLGRAFACSAGGRRFAPRP
jgi:hypothetical protein